MAKRIMDSMVKVIAVLGLLITISIILGDVLIIDSLTKIFCVLFIGMIVWIASLVLIIPSLVILIKSQIVNNKARRNLYLFAFFSNLIFLIISFFYKDILAC